MSDIVERLTHPNCGPTALRQAVEILNREKGELRADNERLRAALTELCDLVEDAAAGKYKIDSFTSQPARRALENKP